MPSFVTGTIVIDAPASALNNSGEKIPMARTDNTSSVKYIRANDGKTYPYVSAQAARYWLRDTLRLYDSEWRMSKVYREDKVAYTDANPIEWWDDDLLGYMCAPGKKDKSKQSKNAVEFTRHTALEVDKDGNEVTVTRSAPFRVGTLVSIAPVDIVNDFGIMARQEGSPAPFEHQMYRATLSSLFSLDLNMAGKFYYQRRTGFQNLDSVRRAIAESQGLEHIEQEKAYRLPQAERIKRIKSLLIALGQLQGGAKQSLHYTDVTPAIVICAVTSGGNHPFNYLFQESRGALKFDMGVFRAAVLDAKDRILSPIFIGWKHGYAVELRKELEKLTVIKMESESDASPKPSHTDSNKETGVKVEFSTPTVAMQKLAQWLEQNPEQWDRTS